MKKQKAIYKSDCCNATFETKSNGLWNYYVCDKCWKKTNPKKLDMRKKENKILAKKGSGKMLSRALTNSTPSKNITKKLSPVLPPKKVSHKLIKGLTKEQLTSRQLDTNSNKKPRAIRKVGVFPDLKVTPYKVDGDDEFKVDDKLSKLVSKSNFWWEYMKAKKLKGGEFTIKVLGETVTILPNITLLRIGNDSKQISGNNTFLLLEKKVQEFMVTLVRELPINVDKGNNRYFLADKKAFDFACNKYPKVPKMFWFFSFITLLGGSPSELNTKRIRRILNNFFSSKSTTKK